MEININPNLINLLNTTAAGQGLTPERFVEHHIEKHLAANLRNETVELIKKLTVDEVAQVKSDVTVVVASKLQPSVEVPLNEPK